MKNSHGFSLKWSVSAVRFLFASPHCNRTFSSVELGEACALSPVFVVPPFQPSSSSSIPCVVSFSLHGRCFCCICWAGWSLTTNCRCLLAFPVARPQPSIWSFLFCSLVFVPLLLLSLASLAFPQISIPTSPLLQISFNYCFCILSSPVLLLVTVTIFNLICSKTTIISAAFTEATNLQVCWPCLLLFSRATQVFVWNT